MLKRIKAWFKDRRERREAKQFLDGFIWVRETVVCVDSYDYANDVACDNSPWDDGAREALKDYPEYELWQENIVWGNTVSNTLVDRWQAARQIRESIDVHYALKDPL